jgi:hypothetical protein
VLLLCRGCGWGTVGMLLVRVAAYDMGARGVGYSGGFAAATAYVRGNTGR